MESALALRVLFYYIYIKGLLGPRDANGRVPRSGTRSQSFLSYSKQRLEFSALEYVGERARRVRRSPPSSSDPSSDKLDFDWKTKQSAGLASGPATYITPPLGILALKG